MSESDSMILTDCGVICAAGDTSALLQGLHKTPQETLRPDSSFLLGREGYFGVADMPGNEAGGACSRTCAYLRYLAGQMAESIDRLKTLYPPERLAVVIGSTTTGIREVLARKSAAEVDYHHHQELAAVSEFLAGHCGFKGPNTVVSTACTSGAKALGLARRLINSGWCDAALVGGSESLNRLVCQGFDALESYSRRYCRPFQADRDGINIGEGAALFTMEKGDSGIALAGYSESSDAWHESAPDPKGAGAEAAIRAALADAECGAGDIDYINLHGTGTRLNDKMEAGVVDRVFGSGTPASSTKSVTGHTLGAAGAVEAAIAWLLLDQDAPARLPPQHGAGRYDPELPRINLVCPKNNQARGLERVLSTSFAFGGHNAAVVLSRIA